MSCKDCCVKGEQQMTKRIAKILVGLLLVLAFAMPTAASATGGGVQLGN